MKACYTGWWTTDGGRSTADDNAKAWKSVQTGDQSLSSAHTHGRTNSERLLPMTSRHCFLYLQIIEIDVLDDVWRIQTNQTGDAITYSVGYSRNYEDILYPVSPGVLPSRTVYKYENLTIFHFHPSLSLSLSLHIYTYIYISIRVCRRWRIVFYACPVPMSLDGI